MAFLPIFQVNSFKTILLVIVMQITFQPAIGQTTIKQSTAHPAYWEINGHPALLLGGSSNDNLFQNADVATELEEIAAMGGNYVRCTMSSRDEGDVYPFLKVDSLYNLRRFNPEYWQRFSNFLATADRLGIIVQIELWATFDYYRENWDKNPFNPVNNQSLNNERVRLPEAIPTHPIFRQNPFFWSVPMADNNAQLLEYQQAFVDTLLHIAFQHDNVLYCIDNETSVTGQWPVFWAKYLHTQAAYAGMDIAVTEMFDPHELSSPSHLITVWNDELFNFVDISQNNHQKGDKHYRNGLEYINRIRKISAVRPVNNVKVYGNQRFGTASDAIERFWQNVFMGCAATRFHRPTSGIGSSPEALRQIQSLRMFTDQFPFYRCVPSPELLINRQDQKAYLLAEPGNYYALYFPVGGDITLHDEKLPAEITIEWLHIDGVKWQNIQERRTREQQIELSCPDQGRWAVLIRRK